MLIKPLILALVTLLITNRISYANSTGSFETLQIFSKSGRPMKFIPPPDAFNPWEARDHKQHMIDENFKLPRRYGKLFYNASDIFVNDINGKQHLVNLDLYTVVDEHLEPAFIPETDIYFLLYTRKNVGQSQVLRVWDIDSIKQSNFNPEHPTRILIHGYQGDENVPVEKDVRTTYLQVGDFNIICVDWSMGAKTINYKTARDRVQAVGLRTSRLIDTLTRAYRTSLASNLYVIGHSLGAHVAGNVGKFQNGKINTIFGLDPAGPLFNGRDLDALDKEDAEYVETINTNARLGFFEPLGYENFYPNGGRWQPGCSSWDIFGRCSHSRAVTYFIESIANRLSFQGIKCPSFEHLKRKRCDFHLLSIIRMGGEPSNHDERSEGIYVVLTNSKAPFGRGSGQGAGHLSKPMTCNHSNLESMTTGKQIFDNQNEERPLHECIRCIAQHCGRRCGD